MIDPQHRGWVKCPPGELQRLATRLRKRRRREWLFGAFVVLLATFGIGCGAFVATAIAARSGAGKASNPSNGTQCPQAISVEDCNSPSK